MFYSKKGLTLLEIVFTITLIVFLVSAISLVYIVSLRGWSNLGHRTDLHEKLHFALERMIRDVRGANRLLISNNALEFTLQEGVASSTYQYYLYNASDSCPPTFSQSAYELHRVRTMFCPGSAPCTATPLVCGSGELIVTGLKPPPATQLNASSISGKFVELTLSGDEKGDSLTVRGYVRARNIL